MTTTILDIAPHSIRRSPFNHRKTITGLDELAASIREKGVISPITVRSRPAGHYELVAGERRWRAAQIAELDTIPAIVRDLDDREVLEIQLIENVQRVDVHPLEEADGYLELIEKHGYDVDQVAAKVGKSRATIYARLKLASLASYPREAFLENRLSASVALLIARIPDEALQERATRDVLGETALCSQTNRGATTDAEDAMLTDDNDPMSLARRLLPVVDDAFANHEPVPMSVREAQLHLRRRYMLRLELATFDPADAELVPTAGACATCEFRTGNQRELFEDVDAADVCTRPSCYEAKTAAAWERKAEAAEAAGVKVITADEADRVFTPTAQVRTSSPYVAPSDPVPHDLLPADKIGRKAPTWGDLLGKKLAAIAPKVLVQDPTGAGHELLDRRKVVEVLREHGKIDKPLKPEKGAAPAKLDPYKDDQEKAERKRAQWTRAARAALAEAHAKAGDYELDSDSWRWVLRRIASSVDRIEGEDRPVAELLDAKTLALSPEHLLLSLLLNEAGSLPTSPDVNAWSDPGKNADLMSGLELVGVDYAEHLERIKASDKEAARAEKKLAGKKPKKGKGK